MAIQQLYISESTPLPDVYQYDHMPEKLKNQVYHLWNKFFNHSYIVQEDRNEIFHQIYKMLCEEVGLRKLFESSFLPSTFERDLELYFGVNKDVKINLTQVQVMLIWAEKLEAFNNTKWPPPPMPYQSAELIDDCNFRFRQNGVGYQYANQKIIRLDNEILHKETVQRVLVLLSYPEFKNVNIDFLDAHGNYKEGKLDDCFNDCLKAFESTMKIICDLKAWNFDEKITASGLIKILIDQQFFPSFQQQQLTSLRTSLETSIPTPRNKMTAHGGGNNPSIISESFASYMLYTTGATIRLLVETYFKK